MKPDIEFNPWFHGTAISGPLPCSCGHAIAVLEKAGRCVCGVCASYLSGREYPLRKGREDCRVISISRVGNRNVSLDYRV